MLLCLCLPACMCPVLDWTKIDSRREGVGSKNIQANQVSLSLDIVDSTNIYQAKIYCVSTCLPACRTACVRIDSTKIDSQSEDVVSKNRQAKQVSLSLDRE